MTRGVVLMLVLPEMGGPGCVVVVGLWSACDERPSVITRDSRVGEGRYVVCVRVGGGGLMQGDAFTLGLL